LAGAKHAIVVGVKGYQRIVRLMYADKDARDVADALPLAGFDDERVRLLEDGGEMPVRNTIFHHLGALSSKLDADDQLLFYFSGHGMVQDGVDYLLPIDVSKNALQDTAIPVDRVVQHLRDSGSRRVVMIIDACRDKLPTGKSVDAIGDNTKSVVERSDEGLAVLFSCASHERSFEIDSDDIKQSSFTHCLLDGIKSPEINTLGEVADYLAREVPVLNGRYDLSPQEPYLYAKPDALRDLQVFTLLVAAAAFGVGDYAAFLTCLWGKDKIKGPVYFEVMDFLNRPPHDPGRLKMVQRVHGLEISPERFESYWQLLPRAAPRAAPANAVGRVGTSGPVP
jgi:uncharacterized caspase-like protein